MALRIRKLPLHRRGRNLEAGRVLYVTRRLPIGADEHLVPGAVFDASRVPEARLRALFASRFIGHEPPRVAGPDAPSRVTFTPPKPKRTGRANPPGV